MSADGRTALYAVLGRPIAHSLSPALHNAAFRAERRNALYVACDVGEAELPEAVRGLRALGARGANLTAPLKSAALALADELSPEAQRAGVVNTLRFDDGRITGHNTDGPGFLEFLRRAGVAFEGARVVFVGGGGAVRGLAAALREAGAASLTAIVRDPTSTRPIDGVTLAPDAHAAEAAMREAALVIQATPLGADPADAMPAPADWVPLQAVAVELRYDPAATPWLSAVRARGVRGANGLGLLVEQALLAQQFWHGTMPPRSALEEAVAWSDPFAP